MAGVLIVAEHRRGQLRQVSLELVTAVRGLAERGERVVAAVIGGDAGEVAPELAVPGVDEILAVSTQEKHFDPDVVEHAIEQLIAAESPRVVAFGHTIDTMSVAPALAARLNAGFASDVLDLREDGESLLVTRALYGGKLLGDLRLRLVPAIVTVRPGLFAPAHGTGSAGIRAIEMKDTPATRWRHLGFDEPVTDGVDITSADFLLAVGRGIGDRDNLALLEALADKLGATLAASRPLVDAGWLSGGRQVGQSGNTVKPRVYLALGISGAVQHLAGIRDAECVIAVNLDPDAPIFGVANYGAVADLLEIVKQLDSQAA